MSPAFTDRLLDFFDLHMIKRGAFFKVHNPDLYYVANGLGYYELSVTHEAMMRSTLRKARAALIEALKIENPMTCCQKILLLCCFNQEKLAEEMGCSASWLASVKNGSTIAAYSDRIAFIRQEAQWIMEDIKELLND